MYVSIVFRMFAEGQRNSSVLCRTILSPCWRVGPRELKMGIRTSERLHSGSGADEDQPQAYPVSVYSRMRAPWAGEDGACTSKDNMAVSRRSWKARLASLGCRAGESAQHEDDITMCSCVRWVNGCGHLPYPTRLQMAGRCSSIV